MRFTPRVTPWLLAAVLAFTTGFQAGPRPETELAGLMKTYVMQGLPADWDALSKLPGIRWAALAPTSLTNCLPNGDCYTRQGTATIAGRNLTVVATGARTMVINLFLRNAGPAFGEAALLTALKEDSIGAELARCPMPNGPGRTNWYRLKGEGVSAAVLSVQSPPRPGPGEGFVISQGDKLPTLPPAQLAQYSEQCGAGAERAPVSTLKPHEALARAFTALLLPPDRPVLDWKSLAALPNGMKWDTSGTKSSDLSVRNDPSKLILTGLASYGGREFSLLASGTQTQVKNLYVEEIGLHPRGEHLLGVVYEQGVAVQLVRCGPVYTESTNNWYSLRSARIRPAMILQSIRYDGNNVQDSYVIRLDGTLPARDPRDREPGANNCR